METDPSGSPLRRSPPRPSSSTKYAEGGVLLTIPAALCAGAFILAVRRRFIEDASVRTYWLRAGAVTGLTAIALQETVEFSLQMPGNAALFAVMCGIALHKGPERRTASEPCAA
jgi:hypothetical protein